MVVGVLLLFPHEYRFTNIDPRAVILGLLLSFGGLRSASAANIMLGADGRDAGMDDPQPTGNRHACRL